MNDTIGRSMRFCEECGIAMGLMSREQYVHTYITNPGLCPYCGKPAIKKEKAYDSPEKRIFDALYGGQG